MGTGRSEVDVEYDDTDHHNHGDQHHAKKQEPGDTHPCLELGTEGKGVGKAGCGQGYIYSLAYQGDGHGCGRQPLGDKQQEDRLGQEH